MNRVGGEFSDTQDQSSGGTDWGQVADDFQVTAPATIRHVTWWGFYNHDVLPSVEIMRIRFYAARPSDGLPGDILFQESIPNPSRFATGVIVPFVPPGTTGTAAEYQFESDLSTPMVLDANT